MTLSEPKHPRIVLVGPGPGTRGGIAQFNLHLAKGLATSGSVVTMLALDPVYPVWTRAGRQGRVEAPQHLAGFSLARRRLVAWRPWTWVAALREIRRAAPSIVVFQWWHPVFAPCYATLAGAARRSGSRVAYVCHNAEPHEPFPLSRLLTLLALRRADALLVLSQSVGEALQSLLPSTLVIELGHPPYTGFLENEDPTSDERWRRLIDARGRKVVLFFGNVRPYKGLQDLVDAFPSVRAALPTVLVVAGTFFERVDSYREQIARLGLEDDVRLVPHYVADGEVAALFRLADLVVLPYRSGSQTGVAPLAAEFGKPVVVTDAGGIREGLGTAVRVATAGRPDQLASTIVDSLQHPEIPGPPPATWERWRDVILSLGSR